MQHVTQRHGGATSEVNRDSVRSVSSPAFSVAIARASAITAGGAGRCGLDPHATPAPRRGVDSALRYACPPDPTQTATDWYKDDARASARAPDVCAELRNHQRHLDRGPHVPAPLVPAGAPRGGMDHTLSACMSSHWMLSMHVRPSSAGTIATTKMSARAPPAGRTTRHTSTTCLQGRHVLIKVCTEAVNDGLMLSERGRPQPGDYSGADFGKVHSESSAGEGGVA